MRQVRLSPFIRDFPPIGLLTSSFFLFEVVHFILWIWNCVVFDRLGNLVALHQSPHYDNFTVLTIEVVFVLAMTPMAILSIRYFRKKYHALFFNVHHCFLVIWIASSIHSWALWLYLVPPVLMYATDRAVQQYQIVLSALMAHSRILSLSGQAVPGHTVLTIARPFGCWLPGQYVFMCVPAVSLLEWHPFSVARAAPFSDEMTLVCKDMGSTSWTGKIGHALQEDRSIIIDGPHGFPPIIAALVQRFSCLVFIAGGVGITAISPYMSAFMDDEESTPKCTVRLMWIVRDASTLDVLPWLVEAQVHPSIDAARVFVTGDMTAMKQELPSSGDVWQTEPGRPDIGDYLRGVADEKGAGNVFVFSCGPVAMVNDVSNLAKGLGMAFHKEVFDF